MSFSKWLKNLFCRAKQEVEPVVEEVINEVVDEVVDTVKDTIHDEFFDCDGKCNCDCDCKCKEHEETPDPNKAYLKLINWDNLQISDFVHMLTFDVASYGELVDWYKISKFKGLPSDFCIKYREYIDWKVYNKNYLKKHVKELLKSEGRI